MVRTTQWRNESWQEVLPSLCSTGGVAAASTATAHADDPWDRAGGPAYAYGCVASAHVDVVSRTSTTVTFRPTYWVNCDNMKPVINVKGEIGGAGNR
ncbi:hypothetical protein [Enemella dayhoffiae]|uniref:hypothetical protein n=1 Tax=Enemella dayhoffiae TaxID=2016507 RepID=UPI001140711A|nr:hypothetical protein [Enemella dayhoffiae]